MTYNVLSGTLSLYTSSRRIVTFLFFCASYKYSYLLTYTTTTALSTKWCSIEMSVFVSDNTSTAYI